MNALKGSLPTRRDALTMIAASAAVSVAPMQVLAQSKTPIVVTKTRLVGPLSDQLMKTITARRGHQGFLSQKVLTNADSVVLIEEWREPTAQATETYYRKEV
ncbi:hypothetical protein SAMN05444358_11385 [Ruegeria halocynthiae]|uniref:Uncharacterized protein n=1 Tax=Ruegeria halocynthiae TaxID=985054 RepID=A0A1H3F7C6_9RHOB|nr:hypothetical protein [Ruegeria halocynthiae]SDX86886.1 hypothetical protein SAMN05444358_11385 [Ruegeria halocynthiae]